MRFHVSSKTLGTLAVACLLAGLAMPASATPITEHDTIGASTVTLSGITTGGPITFVTDTAAFAKFDATLGTLTSATLSWTITGSENGSGNFAGTGKFNFGGTSQIVTFDTISDPGPKTFDFTGTQSLNLASVTGTGNFTSPFSSTIQQSGFFPWGGTMTLDLSDITLVYNYTPTATNPINPAAPLIGAPEPAAWSLLLAGIMSLAGVRRLRTKRA